MYLPYEFKSPATMRIYSATGVGKRMQRDSQLKLWFLMECCACSHPNIGAAVSLGYV